VNVFDALTMSATAFCLQCQVITFHKVSNIRVVTLDDFLQPEPASKEKLLKFSQGTYLFIQGDKRKLFKVVYK
jgi:hypothetical protein